MIIKNYLYLFLAFVSKIFGRGITYRKKLFKTVRILDKNYQKGSSFCFLQVGANDGKSFDYMYGFIVERDCSGVLIEPIKDYYMELCENYKTQKKLLKVNKAVHKTEKFVTLYKIDDSKINLYPNWVRGMASFDKTKLTRLDFLNKEHVLEERVEAIPLMEIVNSSNIQFLDYFQIDTEGYDYEVMDMFDFTVHKPKLLKAEFAHLTKVEQDLMKEKLVSNGYYVFYEDLDIVGVNLRTVRL